MEARAQSKPEIGSQVPPEPSGEAQTHFWHHLQQPCILLAPENAQKSQVL